MGSFDGAEICELVGLYILEKLTDNYGKNIIGLRRDDVLATLCNKTGSQIDRAKKALIKIFKENDLAITVETNLQSTDFLDVTLDLANNRYFPYRKPGNTPLYINSNSNHPGTIVKQLPYMINRRISDISCNKQEFDKSAKAYESALRASGYNFKMEYQERPFKRKNRKRNIIWFNPPFSKNVQTNIGKIFMTLIKKHFPKHHKFYCLFNKNNIKISYSCMENIGNIIKKHNQKILNKDDQQITHNPCNCRKKDNCPLEGECRASNIIYKATIKSQHEQKIYYGLCEGEFKARYSNYLKSFKHEKYKSDTELSKYIWELKSKNCQFDVSWTIAAKAPPYRCGAIRCDLCLTEKLIIAKSDPKQVLNKRAELISKCRHQNKFCLNKC